MVMAYVPAGTVIVSGPGRALASWMAARSVHVPVLVRHSPLPTLAVDTVGGVVDRQ